MKNIYYILVVVALLVLGAWYFRPTNNIEDVDTPVVEEPKPDLSLLPQLYKNSLYKFTINLPEDFVVDEDYRYESTPQKSFPGVRFKIPKNLYKGTNLSEDSYISVEFAQAVADACIAQIFLDSSELRGFADAGKHRYTVAYSLGAGAGNRYEETVYATPVEGGCLGIRYFVHYGVFENYPAGSIKEFDPKAITGIFDAIRTSIEIGK